MSYCFPTEEARSTHLLSDGNIHTGVIDITYPQGILLQDAGFNELSAKALVEYSAYFGITGVHCRGLLRLLGNCSINAGAEILRYSPQRVRFDWLCHDGGLLEAQIFDESRHFGQGDQIYELDGGDAQIRMTAKIGRH